MRTDGRWLVRFRSGDDERLGGTSPLNFDTALEVAIGMIARGEAVERIEPAPEFDDPLEYTPPPLPTQRTYNEQEVLDLCMARSKRNERT